MKSVPKPSDSSKTQRNTVESTEIKIKRIADAYPGILFEGRGSTHSVEGRENGDLGGGSPLVRGSAQFANE
jgi:hypothetical protein